MSKCRYILSKCKNVGQIAPLKVLIINFLSLSLHNYTGITLPEYINFELFRAMLPGNPQTNK